MNKTIPAAYTSVWDGVSITTACQFGPDTGTLSNIEPAVMPESFLTALKVLEKQYVTIHGHDYPVEENDDGELAAVLSYEVFVSRNGYCQVKATSPKAAMRIVEETFSETQVSWDDDWHPTDVQMEEPVLDA